MKRRHLPLLASAPLALLLAGPASAAAVFGQVPHALMQAAMTMGQDCSTGLTPAIGSRTVAAPARTASKASEILGGMPSALDRMRQQQTGQLARPGKAGRLASTAPGSTVTATSCQNLALPRAPFNPGIGQLGIARQRSDDFLASRRIRIRRTSFDTQWNRVSAQGLGRAAVRSLTGANPGKASSATLLAVNAWANARIRYVEDKDLYGRADYWASARTTLKRRAGDCEDIAIAKMQILAALGISRRDMYLTVARDLARNADHAVLIVRLGKKYWMLDNSTNRVLDAARSHDYRPIMSFSQSGKWLHGYAQL